MFKVVYVIVYVQTELDNICQWSLYQLMFFLLQISLWFTEQMLLNMFKVFDDLIFFQFSYSIEATFPCIYIVFSFKFIMYAFWYNGFHYVLEKILKSSSSKKHFLNILLNMYNKKNTVLFHMRGMCLS